MTKNYTLQTTLQSNNAHGEWDIDAFTIGVGSKFEYRGHAVPREALLKDALCAAANFS